jgi:predicted ester cyclase
LVVSDTNKDIIRRYQDAYNRNDLDVLDEVLDPNWTTNGWPEVMPQTIEGAKELYQMLLAGFPDLSYETLDLIAEGDKVVQHWKARGTFKGEMFGLPPTGNVVEADGISIFRITGGKIVEHWAFGDDLGFWEQMGVEFPEFMSAVHHKTS